MRNDKKQTAASIIATGGSGSEAARQAGVNRSTITRWLADPSFQQIVLEYQEGDAADDVGSQASKSLADLVQQAVGVIEAALSGDNTKISAGRLALDVVTKAAALAPKGQSGNEAPPLSDLISELDKREKEAAKSARK